MSLDVGSVFAGDYRIVSRLGAGGMGAVYVVEQLSTRKKRALKVMLPSIASSPALRKRFEQEASVGSLIASKHVVEVHAAGVEGETPWLVMELLDGETLEARVQRGGPLSPQELREVYTQLVHALGAAHAAGIVHRDLKPENVFMAKSELADGHDVLKVLDFGIAKLTLEQGSKTTDAMGSPLWMAPEQTERLGVDARADVWAMGLIAYFLLTGRSFWRVGNDDHSSVAQAMREILFEPIPPADERAKEQGCTLPPGFAEWFAKAVVRETKERYANATEAWAALEPKLDGRVVLNSGAPPANVLDETAVAPAPNAPTAPAPAQARVPLFPRAPDYPSPATPTEPPPPSKRQKFPRKEVLVAVSILALGTLALVGVGAARTPPPPPPRHTDDAPTASVATTEELPVGVLLKMPAGTPADRAVLQKASSRFRHCYKKSDAKHDGKGTVSLVLATDDSGAVKDAKAHVMGPNTLDVEPSCMASVASSLHFAPGPNAITCMVTLYRGAEPIDIAPDPVVEPMPPAPASVSAAASVKPVIAAPTLPTVKVHTGKGSEADRAKLLAAAPAFQACYRKSLVAKQVKGSVELTIEVDESGAPTVSSKNQVATEPPDIPACFEGVVRSLRFSPGPSTVTAEVFLYPFG